MATPTPAKTNGAHAYNGAVPATPDWQAWRDAVAMYAQRAHDYYGPDLAGGIDKARRIVLDGRVKPNGTHAHVGSETDAETIYAVTRDGCDCIDAESKAPQGMCKHRIAWQIYRCAYGALYRQAAAQADPAAGSGARRRGAAHSGAVHHAPGWQGLRTVRWPARHGARARPALSDRALYRRRT